MAICIAILAHESPESLEDLLANIRHFCPGSIPVVYNGSGDPGLFAGISAPVCPYSRKVSWGRLERYILDSMRWAVETGVPFDFFVVLDSDALFINPGYEAFLERELRESEYMGVDFRREDDPFTWWYPGQTAWAEWDRWHHLLGVAHPYGVFNVGQVFRRRLVERILRHPRLPEICLAIEKSQAFALEEVLFPTLAVALGARPRSYPPIYSHAVQFRPGEGLSLEEVRQLRSDPNCHLVHPVARKLTDAVRWWIGTLAGYAPAGKARGA